MTSSSILKLLKAFKKVLPIRSKGWLAIIAAVIILLIAVIELQEPQPLPKGSELPTTQADKLYQVQRISDGDTIDIAVNSVVVPVRLIGVDTPESVDPRRPVQCFGREASSFTKSRLEGRQVYVEADPTQDNADTYNRLLRYVRLEDGTDFNALLIAEGYAFEYTFKKPHQRQEQYQSFELQARQQQRGLWNPDTCNGHR